MGIDAHDAVACELVPAYVRVFHQQHPLERVERFQPVEDVRVPVFWIMGFYGIVQP
jgi:hypothetical protein